MTNVALIAGASGKIGASCAEYFASKGISVLAHYNSNRSAGETVANGIISHGGKAFAAGSDLSTPEEARRLASLAEYRLGNINALVYAAGISTRKPFLELSDDDFTDIMEVNFMGAVRLARAVVPSMIDAGGGSIVLVSSMWGEVGASCESHYAASKGAMDAFAKSLAKELGVYNIRVNVVSPGLIDTPMNAGLTDEDLTPILNATPLSRKGRPIDVAKAAYWLAFGADFVTGQILGVNGGYII